MPERTGGKMIVIAGPTAVGKSELAAELGRVIGGEVISADSMQVYRHMDIGSAKITKEEMLGVPHHMLDVTEPSDPMDVSRYAAMAKKCIRKIQARGHIPIVCGGTGFYIQALVRDVDFGEKAADDSYRERLEQFAGTHGNAALYNLLSDKDPAAAAAIHPNNRKRVIRALEYLRDHGRSITLHNEEERRRESPYELHSFLIEDERSRLYERIERRVDFMMAEGLAEEVRYLQAMGLTASDQAMQGIGYKEVFPYLDGVYDEAEMVRLIKRNSRRYAKRQLTWFRNREDMIRLSRADFHDSTQELLAAVLQQLRDSQPALSES